MAANSKVTQIRQIKPLAAIKSAVRSDVGLQRTENQDSFGVLTGTRFHFYTVADGMGGTRGGEIASATAVKVIENYLKGRNDLDCEVLRQAALEANRKIFEQSSTEPNLQGMGTTVVSLAFVGTQLMVMHVGDSRAYRLRKGKLSCLTEDHTFATELKRSGAISSSRSKDISSKDAPISHLLSRSLGPLEKVEPECRVVKNPPTAGDIYLLCSDGLYGLVSEEKISQILSDYEIEKAVSLLVDEALSAGGTDNVTVLGVLLGDDYPIQNEEIEEEIETQSSESARFQFNKSNLSLLFTAIFLVGLVGGAGFAITYQQYETNLRSQSVKQTESTVNSLDAKEMPGLVVFSENALNSSISKEDQSSPTINKDQSVADLQRELDRIRAEIDIETRKLSAWHGRQQRCFQQEDLTELASEVAVSVPSVKEKIRDYENVHWRYLSEAENLIYNPVDRSQEQKVAELTRLRKERLNELNQEVRKSIDTEVTNSLKRVKDLTQKRDRTQAALTSFRDQLPANAAKE